MKKILLVLAVIGLCVRLWQFGRIPLSLYWDEAAIGLDARSLLQTGRDLNSRSWLQPIFISYGDYKAPAYIWLVTILGKFSGVSELTVRLPSLLASLAVAWILFKLFGRWAAVSFLIMPWAVHFSRIGFESHLSLFWLMLMVWLIYKKNYLAPLAGIAGIYSYISLRLIAPLLFLNAAWKQGWKYCLFGLAAIGLSIMVLTRSPFYPASQQYRLSNDNLVTAALPLQAKLKQFILNYSAYFDPQFLLVSGDPNLRHHSGWGGELLLVQGLLLLLGLTAKPSRLMIGWLLLAPVVAALVNETPHASRAIYMIVPLAYLIGLGWQNLKPKWGIIAGLLLLVNFAGYFHDYFNHYPARSAIAWIKPYKDAALKQYDSFPVYIDPKLYKPELYFAFYRNDLSIFRPNQQFYYYLPSVCPTGAVCLDQF
jgi:hypothetical protein